MPIVEMGSTMEVRYLFELVQIETTGRAETYVLKNEIDASATMQAAPAWAASTVYEKWEVVRTGGSIYQCKQAHTSGASFESDNWILVRAEVPLYSNASTYAVGDVVRYPTTTPDGVYQCKVEITAGEEWNSAKWVKIANLGSTMPNGYVGVCSTSGAAFIGTLDGGGYTIRHLYQWSNTTEQHGLFGYLGENGVVRNLYFANGCLYRFGTGGITGTTGLVAANFVTPSFKPITIQNVHAIDCLLQGGNRVGSFVGEANSCFRISIQECSSNAIVKSNSSFVTGAFVGGLVGSGVVGYKPYGTGIKRCLFNGSLYGNSSTKAHVGGLYGGFSATTSAICAEDCIFSGSITGSVVKAGGIAATALSQDGNYYIKACLNTGTISLAAGTKYGINENIGYVENCYYDTQTTGCTDRPTQQRTTEQMKKRSFLVGLDFDRIWYLPKSPVIASPFNGGYPIQRHWIDIQSSGVSGGSNMRGAASLLGFGL